MKNKKAEVRHPSRNIFHYQDSEIPGTYEGPPEAPVGDFEKAFKFFNYPPNGEQNEQKPEWSEALYNNQGRDQYRNAPEGYQGMGDGKPQEYWWNGQASRYAIKEAMRMFKETDIQFENEGIDDFLKSDPVRIASIDELLGFTRISKEVLVNTATNDFWKLSLDEEGNPFIEKLYDKKDKEDK